MGEGGLHLHGMGEPGGLMGLGKDMLIREHELRKIEPPEKRLILAILVRALKDLSAEDWETFLDAFLFLRDENNPFASWLDLAEDKQMDELTLYYLATREKNE